MRTNILNEAFLLSFPIHHFVPLEYLGKQVHVVKDRKLKSMVLNL